MYDTFYGLTGKPFQLNPDPSFFYGSRGHKRAMAYLEYGLHQSEGFIVITGEVGAGKTTLVRNLLQKLDPQKVVAAQLVSTQLDAEDTLRMVAASFGLPSKTFEKAELLLALEMFLVSITSKGKRALLIVDEAQNLTPRAVEELRMLSNFQLEDHALLQSFLIGQPEFKETMQSEHMRQLRQRVIASYHLGPMDREETRAYIEHRLSHVGWKGNPRFEPAVFDVIFENTGGIPRRINTVCDRLMLAGFLSGKTAFQGSDAEEVVREIRDETGGAGMGPGAVATAGAVRAVPSVGTAQVIEIDASGKGGVTTHTLKLDLKIDVSRFETRLQKLEQQMTEAVRFLGMLTGRQKTGSGETNGKAEKARKT
jgi:putative secretion ATPase (PEP-CTERM system associated)